MVILRATQKVMKSLSRSVDDADVSNNALGDWYVNRITVDRKPLLLLMSENCRLPILEPARDVRHLPDRLSEVVARRLQKMDVQENGIAKELAAMKVVRVGPTRNRSVVGQMVDFAKAIPFYLPVSGWDEKDLAEVERRLGETPCLCSGRNSETIWPDRDARRLLEAT